MGATVAVLGGGAWGSALTVHLAVRSHARPRVVLYLRSARQAHDCAAARENARYLPGITLPASLIFTTELADLRDAEVLIAATPVAGLVPLAAELVAHRLAAPLVLAC